ncbi:MAG TPA: right-handed parallel beta-helix repeat-containing protein [Verrucomicrobiae bacterium]|nr:right-handed parallel beta-helix repeat-containing protein [Verrucomicrobiae bacterium]
MKIIAILVAFTSFGAVLRATEFNVATNGNDTNSGTSQAPFRTIQQAADVAQPGDVITVHEGVYRERVDPPRGGTSDAHRITYQAAPREHAVITGSERVKNWTYVTNDVWRVIIPNSFFGEFNPYSDVIHGDWCSNPHGYHTGAVYLNGDWLTEAASIDNVLNARVFRSNKEVTPLWFGRVNKEDTTIWAQFPGVNPNNANVEINVRRTVFTPSKTGINYVTVRGFELRDAAAPWAPPTAAQIGIISAFWCKGWIIENNKICYSPCSGVALGKYGDDWDNRAQSAEGYVGTIHRALNNGWNKATVGSHLVRNNEISHCEQTGVVGSLGCSFSTVAGNEIHDIHIRDLYGGAEMAGIKFHGAIDVTISRNHIYRCSLGLWLDWMAQGARVTGNLFHDNNSDFFFEMQHGPILVANNLFLSKRATVNSEGVAFVQNLMAGTIANGRHDKRVTPFQVAHSTEIAGMYPDGNGDSGDHRFYNNLFVASCDQHSMDGSMLRCFAAGNVFTRATQPSKFDSYPLVTPLLTPRAQGEASSFSRFDRHSLIEPDFDPVIKLVQKSGDWYLTINEDNAWRNEAKCKLVTTKLLGNAKVSRCAYENADGSRIRVNTDYFGEKRNEKKPFPGPFETISAGPQEIKVWPLATVAAHLEVTANQ